MVGVRAKDHDEKRQLVLERAAELFARQGFDRTSIAQISAACNASKAWVYHYYPTKDEILFTLLKEFFETILERVEEVVGREDDPRAQFSAFIKECLLIYIEYRINYPALFRDIVLLNADYQKTLRELERQYALMLQNIIVKINRKFKKSEQHIEPVTLLLFGTMNWTYTWYDPDGEMKFEELHAMTEKLLYNGLIAL